jgi:predicted nucleic acid-binding protein
MRSDLENVLIDTNVLVYAYDPSNRDKQERAIAVLDALVTSQRAVLSVQCLTEFYSVVTKRLAEPLSDAEAVEQTERLARSCRVLDLTSSVVLEGCRGAGQHQMSLWDALIWAIAKLNQVPVVLTEDAPHGRFLEGVSYANPFQVKLDPADLLEFPF